MPHVKRAISGLIIASLLIVSAGSVFAIGEITPTPQPDTNQPAPTLPPSPTLVPSPTAVPDTPETDDVDAILDEAVAAFQAGDFETAIVLLNEVLTIDQSNAEAFAIRGVSYSQLGSLSRAIDDFTRAIELVPYDWTFHVFRAQVYEQQGEIGLALQDLDIAIELNPRYELAFRSRAIVNSNLRPEEARLDELMAQGLRAQASGNFAGAIGAFTDVVDSPEATPNYLANAYYNRALTHYTQENLTQAIADYSAGISAVSDMHDLYLGRGIALRETGDIRGAGEDFYERITLLEDNTVEQTIAFNEPRTVDMAYGNVYRLTFSGLGGESVTITARDVVGVSVDPLIVLLDPNGVPIAGDDDFGGTLDSLIENFRLPADGTYTIVVSHANGGYVGDVRVTLE